MQKKLFIILSFLFFVSCNDNYFSSLPNVPVNFSCSLLQSPYSLITTPNQFFTVKKNGQGFVVASPGQKPFYGNKYGVYLGNAGIILGNSSFHGYCAYDLACPWEYKKNNEIVAIELQNTLDTAICHHCKSKYDLNNGGIRMKGVSDEQLKVYRNISFRGNEITVTN